MSHILNHNRVPFQFKIDRSLCWDFFLDAGTYSSPAHTDGFTERCLIASVDLNECGTVMIDDVFGSERYIWEDAKNEGLSLDNIGITGMDNGTITFDRNTITVDEFNALYGESSLKVDDDDMRLHFRKVGGNNGIFTYANDIVLEDGVTCARLNGGFWQGFFKSGNSYQLLPTNIGNGICLEFVIKPDSSLADDSLTLNGRHPDNKGIFFYIGTRAENKWYKYAEHEDLFEKISNTYFGDDGYIDGSYFTDVVVNIDYFNVSGDTDYSLDDGYFADAYGTMECPKNLCAATSRSGICGCSKCKPKRDCSNYFNDGYFDGGSVNECVCIPTYAEDGYGKPDDALLIDDMDRQTTGGHSLTTPNIVEIETDNKFLIFDRTCDGMTADQWEEGTTAIITDIKADERENYFLLYHRGCDGLLADKTWSSRGDRRYDANKDLYRNAFALQMRDDGSVGFKYMVKNCDCDGDDCTAYEILDEWTMEGAVADKEWSVIHLLLLPLGVRYKKCDTATSARQKMRAMLYVNGKLKLISREMPQLNLRKLDETDDKQEGVPFNISLGGGTQGLSDVVYYDFSKTPDRVLPLEKEFGGSFVGYFRTFRMYDCPISLSEMADNVSFAINTTNVQFL